MVGLLPRQPDATKLDVAPAERSASLRFRAGSAVEAAELVQKEFGPDRFSADPMRAGSWSWPRPILTRRTQAVTAVVDQERLAIQPVLENRVDVAIRLGASHARAVARGIESLRAVLLGEAQQPETGERRSAMSVSGARAAVVLPWLVRVFLAGPAFAPRTNGTGDPRFAPLFRAMICSIDMPCRRSSASGTNIATSSTSTTQRPSEFLRTPGHYGVSHSEPPTRRDSRPRFSGVGCVWLPSVPASVRQNRTASRLSFI